MNLVNIGGAVAIRWDGKAATVADAAAMMAPRYNVFRFNDPLQGDVLKVCLGAESWTVAKEKWLARSDRGEPMILTDKQLSASLRAVVA